MFAELFMVDGTKRVYEVTEVTCEVMKTDLDSHDEVKYETLTGAVKVDWSIVSEVKFHPDDPRRIGIKFV